MAGFCTKCGSPLDENGNCPKCSVQQSAPQQQAAPQQPYQAQQPYNYQAQQPYQAPYQSQQPYQAPYQAQPAYQAPKKPNCFSNLGKLLGSYFKDPVGASRSAFEKKDFVSGLLIVAANFLVVFLGLMFFCLTQQPFPFKEIVLEWIFTSLLGVVLAYGLTFGICFVMGKLGGAKTDPMAILSVVCVNGILPTALLAVSMLLGMATPVLFEIFAVLAFAAWAATTFIVLFRVMNVKMNILNTLLLIVMMAAAYFVVMVLLCWLLFAGNCGTFIAGFYHLFNLF